MKRFSLFVFLVFGFLVWQFYRYFTSPLDPQSQLSQQIVVKPGASVSQIAQDLQQKHLIRSALAFKFIVKLNHLDGKLQAGLFKLSPAQAPLEIAQTLTHGQLDRWLTIPEGFRREQIAELLAKNFAISSQEFLQLTRHREGWLFPDTYLIPLTATPQQVVNLFLSNYQRKIKFLQPLLQQSKFTEKQVLTLASIVERETLSDQEKPIVAGILIKRLQNNWPLQVDATIQYILGKPGHWWPVPTLADRQLKSPYNTYLHQGLPPTPIANPGLASIKAVLQPQSTSYWFYLHDKSGNIHYAETTAQHQQNIRQYLYTK